MPKAGERSFVGRQKPGAFWHGLAILGPLALVTVPAIAAGDQAIPPKSERAHEVRLSGDTVTLPIVMVQEFPFVEGAVAGVKGKFMLDTGTEQALVLNDHRVPVTNVRTIGTGKFGSGQVFAARLVPEVADLQIGPLHFPRATLIQTQDASLLESITPDFLGFFGYYAWADYALKLDYKKSRAIFYKGGPEHYLKGETVIAELPFETRRIPNSPVMHGRIGEMAVIVTWDTGQYGSLNTNAAGKAELLRTKHLLALGEKAENLDLTGLEVAGYAMPDISGLEVETEPSPAAVPIGISEPHMLTIGYGLLRQYKTVWDYRRKRIFLLAN